MPHFSSYTIAFKAGLISRPNRNLIFFLPEDNIRVCLGTYLINYIGWWLIHYRRYHLTCNNALVALHIYSLTAWHDQGSRDEVHQFARYCNNSSSTVSRHALCWSFAIHSLLAKILSRDNAERQISMYNQMAQHLNGQLIFQVKLLCNLKKLQISTWRSWK